MNFITKFGAAVAALACAGSAHATVFTTTSPTGGALPSGVTEVGGIVLDLTGANGNRVVSQLSAASLFVGYSGAGVNPLTIGTQTGFGAVIGSLGGGLQGASVRITLSDGDSASGDFDFNQNTLLLDGINFGNFSSVATQETSADGLTLLSSGFGFGNGILSTGFFSTTDSSTLASLFAALGDGQLAYAVDDVDPNDNFYDFTQGVAGSLVNVGTGPTVTPGNGSAVPEPATWAMMVLGFAVIGASLRRRQQIRVTYA